MRLLKIQRIRFEIVAANSECYSTFEVAKDVEKAAADIKAYMASQSEGEVDEIKQARMKKVASPALAIPAASWRDAYEYFTQWRNAKILIGTTLSWFFLVRNFPLLTAFGI